MKKWFGGDAHSEEASLHGLGVRWHAGPAMLVLASLVLLATSAQAFEGHVVSAYDGTPMSGVLVRDLHSDERTTSGSDGAFTFPGDADARTLQLIEDAEEGANTLIYGPLNSGRTHTLRMFPAAGPPPVVADDELGGWGIPRATSLSAPDEVRLERRLQARDSSVILPESIRVAMHVDSDCSQPIAEVVEVPIEDYVEGAVYSEIGVFTNLPGGPQSAHAVLATFAIAARSYALYFYYRDPDADWHINNTACNQRYEPVQSNPVRQAVEATAGVVFVDAANTNRFGKYEYAASCGRHGSRPEHQTELVPDLTGIEACVGSWCGHNSCAAHEVNPDVPDEGRCLVRGICQWGAAERSVRGDTWQEIVAHYQPHLEAVALNDAAPTRVRGYVRSEDPLFGDAVAGARVTLSEVGSTTTDGGGGYAFDDVAPGTYLLRVSAPEFAMHEEEVALERGRTTWRSVVLSAAGEVGGDTDSAEEGDAALDTAEDAEPHADLDSQDDRSDTRQNSEVAGGVMTSSSGCTTVVHKTRAVEWLAMLFAICGLVASRRWRDIMSHSVTRH